MNLKKLSDDQYGLLFDVRRSMRYHDRRRAFFERMHRVTNVLTVLMAGSVLFELGRTGETAGWLILLSVAAALLAAFDMVVGYGARAALHRDLKRRFADLEIAMMRGGLDEEAWREHQIQRLAIERDEPPVYRALDLLCHNEQLAAEGSKEPPAKVSPWQRYTSQLLLWPDLGANPPEPAPMT